MTKESAMPRISVVIPVYNRADLLRAVLLSLEGQTMPNSDFEILVCDDGSTEDLGNTIQPFEAGSLNVRHLRQQNRGPAAARNLGIANASAELVLFVDSDVVLGDKFVESMADAFIENPDWIGSEARLIPIEGDESPNWDAPRSTGGHYHTAGLAIRRDLLLEVGGMDENYCRAACEDVELATRVLKFGEIGFVGKAEVFHPRRYRTIATCWRSRLNWRYVMYLASTYGFLAWPSNPTRFPRLRTAVSAVITLPMGKALRSLRYALVHPASGLRATLLAVVDGLGGMVMVPTILFSKVPSMKSALLREKSATK